VSQRARRIGLFVLVAVAVVAVDQLVKAAMRAWLEGCGPVTLIPGVMDLQLVYNTGAAFSMGEGLGWLFMLSATAVCVACAAYVAWGRPSAAFVCALGLVAGGGAGNLVDRALFGCVTDFFTPTFVDFAVFNVADIAITLGYVAAAVLLLCNHATGHATNDAGRREA
jgi:signal peptidase II